MPLDKVLVKHLDEQDLLRDKLENDIDELLSQIDIPGLMADVEGTLMTIVDELQERLKTEYYEIAVKRGVELAQTIEEDGDIQIQKTDIKE